MIDRHAVKALHQAGVSTQEIAGQFGVSRRTIQRIVGGTPSVRPTTEWLGVSWAWAARAWMNESVYGCEA